MTDSIVLIGVHLNLIELSVLLPFVPPQKKTMIANNRTEKQKNLKDTALTSDSPGSEMLTNSQWTITAQTLRLTKRETQVCQKLFDGITRNEIAEHLGIKPRTVRHYMEHIHEKLAVCNRVGVVLRIIQLRDQIDTVTNPDENQNRTQQPVEHSE